jgi:hypothetical protein
MLAVRQVSQSPRVDSGNAIQLITCFHKQIHNCSVFLPLSQGVYIAQFTDANHYAQLRIKAVYVFSVLDRPSRRLKQLETRETTAAPRQKVQQRGSMRNKSTTTHKQENSKRASTTPGQGNSNRSTLDHHQPKQIQTRNRLDSTSLRILPPSLVYVL